MDSETANKKQRWKRPDLEKIDPAQDALSTSSLSNLSHSSNTNERKHNTAMQWIDIDMYQTNNILRTNPKAGDRIPGASVGTVPVIRIYGVNEKGNSIVMHVHGFTPYFYVQAPPGFKESHTAAFRVALDNQVRNSARGVKVPMYILGVSVCEKQSIWGYTDKKSTFLKIYTALPNFVATARNILQQGFEVPGTIPRREYLCYESSTPFVLRFMIDKDIVGCNWLELPAGSYSVRRDTPSPKDQFSRTSLCQAEIDVVCNNIISHAPEGEWMKQAPFRILSFDIECQGRHGFFPDAKEDPVIQIANIVTVQGEKQSFVRALSLSLSPSL